MLLRAFNRHWLKYLQPWVLIFSSAVQVRLISTVYFAGFLTLLLCNPSRFLPSRIKVSFFVNILMACFAIFSLVGLLVLNVLEWTIGVGQQQPDGTACGRAITYLALVGWEILDDSSAMKIIRHILPDFCVLLSSVYLSVMLWKGQVFGMTDYSMAAKRRQKQMYLQKHFQTSNQHSLFNYCLLFSLFFAGVAFSAVFSAVYFVGFMIGLIMVTYGYRLSDFMEKAWAFFLLFSCLNTIMVYLYQFPQISGNIIDDDFEPNTECDVTDPSIVYDCEIPNGGITEILGLYRYVCFNDNVLYHWYYPIGYVFMVFSFVLLAHFSKKRIVLWNLKAEGFKVLPSRVTAEEEAQYRSCNVTGNKIYDMRQSALQAKVFFGTHGYKFAYLGIIITAIFLPSLLIFPPIFCVIITPFLNPRYLYKMHIAMFWYLVCFLCVQYLFNMPGIAHFKKTACQEGHGCYDCGAFCILEDLGFRPFAYSPESAICTGSKPTTFVSFPLLGIQCFIVAIFACFLRFRIPPHVNKMELKRMVETQNILRKDFVFKAEVRGRKRGGRSVSVLTGNESNRLSESEDKPPLKEHPYYNGIESGRRPGSGKEEIDTIEEDEKIANEAISMSNRFLNSILASKTFNSLKREMEYIFIEIAKRFYGVSLIALFVCGLSDISLIKAVYICFFAIFVLFPKQRRPLWKYLIGYTSVVLFTLLFWQISWTIPFDCSLVGLIHYSSFMHPTQENPCYHCSSSGCIWDLWRALFWHGVILVTAVGQHLLDLKLDSLGLNQPTPIYRRAYPPPPPTATPLPSSPSPTHPSLMRESSDIYFEIPDQNQEEMTYSSGIVTFLEKYYYKYGLVIVYSVLLVVATTTNDQNIGHHETEQCSTNTQTSVINVVYMLFFFICMNLHHALPLARSAVLKVFAVAVPVFTLIFFLSYLVQWPPFVMYVMDPFQTKHGDTDYFKWAGLVTYNEFEECFTNERCCYLTGGGGICGYCSINNFIDWNVISGLAPRAAVMTLTVWQYQALSKKIKEGLPREELIQAPWQSESVGKIAGFFRAWTRFCILHMHKICTLTMFSVAVSELTVINLVLLVISLITTQLKDGADPIGMGLLLFVETITFGQFGFRFICPDQVKYRPDGSIRSLPTWFGFEVHETLWDDIIGYILIVIALVLLRFSKRWQKGVKKLNSPGVSLFGEPCALFPTPNSGLFGSRKMDYEAELANNETVFPSFTPISSPKRPHLIPTKSFSSKKKFRKLDDLNELSETPPPPLFPSNSLPSSFMRDYQLQKEKEKEKEEEEKKQEEKEEKEQEEQEKEKQEEEEIVEVEPKAQPSPWKADWDLLKNTFGWYFSHFFRIHGYELLRIAFPFVIFARNNLFSLVYYFLFLWACMGGKWMTYRVASLMLFFVSLSVVMQYVLMMFLPIGMNSYVRNFDCGNDNNDLTGMEYVFTVLKCGMYSVNIFLAQWSATCYKKEELLWDLLLCWLLGLIVRQNKFFPHLGKRLESQKPEKKEMSPCSGDEFQPLLSHGPSQASLSSSSDSVGSPLSATLFSDASPFPVEEKQGEEVDLMQNLGRFRYPFSLTNQQLHKQDLFTIQNLIFSSSEDFMKKPRTLRNFFKFSFYVSCKTYIIMAILVLGTLQADASSIGYVGLSVSFWYLDEYLGRNGNKVWRWLIYFNLGILTVQTFYQPLVVFFRSHSAEFHPVMAAILSDAIGLKPMIACSCDNSGKCGEDMMCPEKLECYDVVAFTSGGALYDIIIFILVWFQYQVFASDDWKFYYQRVLQVRKHICENWVNKEKKRKEKTDLCFLEFEKKEQTRKAALEEMRQSRVKKYKLQRGVSFMEISRTPQQWDQDIANWSQFQASIDESAKSEAKNPFLREEKDQEEEDGMWKWVKEEVCKSVTKSVDFIYRSGAKKKRDPERNLLMSLLAGLFFILRNNSHVIVYSMMAINEAGNYDVISLFYPLSAFLYAMIAYRKPPSNYWRVCMLYCATTIILKFICTIIGSSVIDYSPETGLITPMLHCADSFSDTANFGSYLVLPIGFSTLDVQNTSFLKGVAYDIPLFLSLLWHRHNLKREGSWWSDSIEIVLEESTTSEDEEEPKREEAMRSLLGLAFVVESDQEIFERMSGHGGAEDPLFDGYEEDMPDDEDQEEEDIREESTIVDVRQVVVGYYQDIMKRKCTADDYYTGELTVEVFCFVFLIFFQNDFTGVSAAELGTIFSSNRIPRNFLLLLFFQFLLIIWGRIVYLKRSLFWKLLTQYTLVFFYHFVLIFYLPGSKGSYQTCPPGYARGGIYSARTWAIVIFYLMKCVYFWCSALQIRTGYPVLVEQRTLYKNPTLFGYIAFNIYYAIPFCYEMRSVLDWATFPTTLDLYQYLKLEDIYVQLFVARYRTHRRETEDRMFGEAQPQFIKIGMGLGIFALLVLLIWFPLFLMSSANPANNPNPVLSASVSIAIQGWDGLYFNQLDATPDESAVGKEEFKALRCLFNIFSDESYDTQDLKFLPYSEKSWDITPPSRTGLINATKFCANGTISGMAMDVVISFERQAYSMLSSRFQSQLTPEACKNLSHILERSQWGGHFDVQGVWPRGVRLPVTGSPSPLKPSRAVLTDDDDQYVDARFTYYTGEQPIPDPENHQTKVNQLTEYWTVEQLNRDIPSCPEDGCNCGTGPCTPENDCYSLFDNEGPELITVSAELLSGIAKQLATIGIIGLYVGLVFAISRFLRLSVSDLYTKIPYEDMPDPSDITNLVEYVFAARQTGDLKLEEELYWEVIALYRSPEEIINQSKKKEKTE